MLTYQITDGKHKINFTKRKKRKNFGKPFWKQAENDSFLGIRKPQAIWEKPHLWKDIGGNRREIPDEYYLCAGS